MNTFRRPIHGLLTIGGEMSSRKKKGGSEIHKPGYHITKIPKGVLGEFSKIEEELLEAKDAISQGCKIMELVELSDLMGALNAYVKKQHNMTLDDLVTMALITSRAFENGRR
jgi:hypothetical protein